MSCFPSLLPSILHPYPVRLRFYSDNNHHQPQCCQVKANWRRLVGCQSLVTLSIMSNPNSESCKIPRDNGHFSSTINIGKELFASSKLMQRNLRAKHSGSNLKFTRRNLPFWFTEFGPLLKFQRSKFSQIGPQCKPILKSFIWTIFIFEQSTYMRPLCEGRESEKLTVCLLFPTLKFRPSRARKHSYTSKTNLNSLWYSMKFCLSQYAIILIFGHFDNF